MRERNIVVRYMLLDFGEECGRRSQHSISVSTAVRVETGRKSVYCRELEILRIPLDCNGVQR